ncbi:J domain-containing protein [Acetobacter persici]|uniref:J domain-containing protein n=1 Tax=Acetobacter persici TaxID=1076596 RepID=A0A1U9LIJ1_9PROT|nr:J domain-containing protein [Acetobacter persici]AQT06232.1 hypothetical protein A0U91_14490 [Acetobacter persici]
MTNYKSDSQPRPEAHEESGKIVIPQLIFAFSLFLFFMVFLLSDAYASLRIWLTLAAIILSLLSLCLHFSDIHIWDGYLMRRSRSAEALSDIERELQYIRDFISQQRQEQERQEDLFRDFLRDFERDRASEHSEGFERASKGHRAKGTAYHHQPRPGYEVAMSVLGLEHGFSQVDLKKAWKKKAFDTHPDHGGSSEKFQEITDAYNCLRA